ncbi:glycosyltransferase family 2 protein [Cryomorphaceae bacterium 1068]|nr:glycosyltransferase family 2 protein [Cryomorphaceae bacterium 1068]
MGLKFVSIIIPCRNEVNFIQGVLNSISAQDYPKDSLEIIVADGMSDDGTRDKLRELSSSYPNLKVIDNPNRVTPDALNLAIEASKGEVIVRLDAHSNYPSNYISRLVTELFRLDAENVGGVWITTPANSGTVATAIALATSHPLGIGNASYRLENPEITEVDTVPFGCFKRSIFDQIGLFDTDLIRNQDDEFNGRIIKNGGKIFLVPDVEIEYYARATFGTMVKMFYQYGLFKPLVNIKLGHPATLRQFAPPIFTLGLLCLPIALLLDWLFLIWSTIYTIYFWINAFVSSKIAWREKRSGLAPRLFLAFFLIHFSYGWGYLKGIFKFVLLKNKVRADQTNLSR